MKCPKCGTTMRPSKKYPGYYLCDKCRKRYPGSSVKKTSHTKTKSQKKKAKKFPIKLLFCLLLIIGVCFLFQSGLLFPGKIMQDDIAQEPTTYMVGETAVTKELELTILSSKTSKGNKTIKPDNGNVFLILEVEATNMTTGKLTLQDVSSFKIIYKGEEISTSALAYRTLSADKTRLNGILDPAGTMSGYVCFEIPKDFDSAELQVSNPIWTDNKITYTIKKESN